jgi:LysM repeat protein
MATYIVKRGDTMAAIARRFGVSLAALKAANPQIGARPGGFDRIYPGDVVNLPANGDQQDTQNIYYVVVNVAGNAVRRSDRSIRSRRASTGEYDVTFPEDVDDWMWQATRGAPNDSDQVAGYVTTQLAKSGNDIVRVKTFDELGNPYNHPFHLTVRRVRP